jgi:hypothetical protein
MYELLPNPTFAAEDGRDDAVIEERLHNLTLKNTIENASRSVSGNTNSNSSDYSNANANASGNTNSGNDGSNDSDAGDWKTVVNKSDPGKRDRRVVNQRQDCPSGLQCKKQGDCGYRHTTKERQLFQQNPNQNLGLRKTQLCRYAPNCWSGRDCQFAHTEAEARCLDCKQTGHFQGDTAKCFLKT